MSRVGTISRVGELPLFNISVGASLDSISIHHLNIPNRDTSNIEM